MKMRWIAIVLILLAGIASVRFPYPATFPYRRCHGQVFNLTALFNWWEGGRRGTRPMSRWIGPYFSMRVFSVETNGGILLLPTSNYRQDVYFLTNYPGADKLIDGDFINFFAMKGEAGHRYTRTDGSQATVELLDYGQVMSFEEFAAYLDSRKPKTK